MSALSVARRDDAILIVIDEQERLAAAMQRRERVAAATSRLVRTAALVGMPVVVTRQYPRGLGDIEPQLAAVLTSAEQDGAQVTVVDKVAFDCFGETGFVEALAHAGRRQLIVVGMESHICVVQTVLSGLREEFEVHVVGDSCCSRDAEHHELALARMRGAGAVVTTTESVMYELVGEAGTDEFRALLGIVKD